MYQNCAKEHAQYRRCLELFGGHASYKDRQEIECCVRRKIQHNIGGIVRRQPAGHVQKHDNDLDHACTHQHRDQRDDTAGYRIKKSVHIGAKCFLCFRRIKIFRDGLLFFQLCFLTNTVINGSNILPNDHLQLVSGPLYAYRTGQLFDLRHVHHSFIFYIKAQPRDTMCKRADVFFSANQANNAADHRIIFVCHFVLLLFLKNSFPSVFAERFITNPFGARSRSVLFPNKNPSAPQSVYRLTRWTDTVHLLRYSGVKPSKGGMPLSVTILTSTQTIDV